MHYRFRYFAPAVASALLSALLAACGGGSGGSSAPATPPPVTSTPGPGTLLVPGRQSSGGGAGGFVNDGKKPSTYAVTSNPSGQTFTVAGQSYTTPATVTPAASSSALSIVFGTGFTVPITQVYDGPHTVFYNASSDSSGTVAVTSLQSIGRATASVGSRSRIAAAVHRPVVRAALRTDVDPTRVAVRMSAAALGRSGRSPADVERAVGSRGRETLSATADKN